MYIIYYVQFEICTNNEMKFNIQNKTKKVTETSQIHNCIVLVIHDQE